MFWRLLWELSSSYSQTHIHTHCCSQAHVEPHPCSLSLAKSIADNSKRFKYQTVFFLWTMQLKKTNNLERLTDDKSSHKAFCFAAVQQFVHFKMSTFPKFYIKCFKKKNLVVLSCCAYFYYYLNLSSSSEWNVEVMQEFGLQITFHWSTGGNTSRPTALHLQRQGRNEDCWKMSVDVNNAGVKMIKKNPLKSKPISLHLEDHSSTMSRWKLNSNLVLLHSSHTNPLKSLNKFEQGDLSTFDT